MTRRTGLILVLSLLAAGYLSSGLTVVQPDEVGVVRRLGRLLTEPWEPGLHWGLPWGFDRVDRLKVNQTPHDRGGRLRRARRSAFPGARSGRRRVHDGRPEPRHRRGPGAVPRPRAGRVPLPRALGRVVADARRPSGRLPRGPGASGYRRAADDRARPRSPIGSGVRSSRSPTRRAWASRSSRCDWAG